METKKTIIPASRHQKIIVYIKQNGSAQIKGLAEYLQVSEATVRRDLDELDTQGLLVRTHGGAILKSDNASSFEHQHNERLTIKRDEKRKIAKVAASFVRDGEAILLDSGTTNFFLAEELANVQNLTVITYDLFIANNMSLHPTSSLIVTGGLRRQGYSNVLWGTAVEDFIRDIRVDKVFLGADAIDMEFGVSNTNVMEASIKKLMIKAGKEVILIADHSKIGKQALARVCQLSDIDKLVIDRNIDERNLSILKEKVKDVYLA